MLRTAEFSPDGDHIITASDDGTARIWDADTGAALAVLEGHEDVVSAATFSADGRWAVTGSYDGSARVWRVNDFFFEPPAEQVRLACAKARSAHASTFTEHDRSFYRLLVDQPEDPCAALGVK